MPTPIQDRIAVSTWSLHRRLGTTYPHDLTTDAIPPAEETYGEGSELLLDLPSLLANHDYRRMELVSFHLPSRDPVYLGELRDQLKVCEVTLQTLLIDAGDITHPTHGARDEAWIAGWIETANELGAANARIIAGKQKPTPETLARSIAALRALADGNAGSPVRLVTENWFDLLASPREIDQVLDALEGRIGLLADIGNWHRPGKYDALPAVFARAELCHAKTDFPDGHIDEEDFGRCIEIAEAAGYAGPYTLVFDSPDPADELAGLAAERDHLIATLENR